MDKTRIIKSVEKYSIAHLQIIVASVAYEVFDVSLMSDNSYDILCKLSAGGMSEAIDEFEEFTGQWVHDIINEELLELTSIMIEQVEACTHDPVIHHTYLCNYLGRED